MTTGWKTWVTMVGGAASIIVLATTVCDPAFMAQEQDHPETAAEDYGFSPWHAEDLVPEEIITPPVEPPVGEGYWIQLIDEAQREVASDTVVSAPGMWPSLSMPTGLGGYLELPAHQVTTMDGRKTQIYELLARSTGAEDREDDSVAFWGLVMGPEDAVLASEARQIRMNEAHPLDVTVIDEEGDPVEGAFVRLSRDSVGLVHLNFTTREDGRAIFRAIPQGTYYLTLDADGHARTTARVEHTKQTDSMKVAMEDGRGLRLPQSWRGPPVQEMAGTSSEDDDVEESSEEEEPTGPTVGLQVYAADDRGSGIDGAWIEAWSAGQRVAQGRSRGNSPEVLQVPSDTEIEIIVTHAGWGEGRDVVTAVNDGDDLIVGMNSELLSNSAAADRLTWIDDIEDGLGVQIVEDGRKLLVELPNRNSAAEAAGLRRGDAVLFVRRVDSGHVAVVERGNQLVEISVP